MIIYDTRIEIHSKTIEEEEKSALFWKSICDFSHEGQVKTMSNAWRKTTERIDKALQSSESHSMNIYRDRNYFEIMNLYNLHDTI